MPRSDFNVPSDLLGRLRFWSREVRIATDLPPDLATDRLRSLINQDIRTRSSIGVVGKWTLFGRIDGGNVHVEAFGPFRGLTSLNGRGAWQPVFKGRIHASGDGSLLVGRVTRHLTYFGFAIASTIWFLIWLNATLTLLSRPLPNYLPGYPIWLLIGLGPILGIAFLTVRGRAQDAYLVELLARFVASDRTCSKACRTAQRDEVSFGCASQYVAPTPSTAFRTSPGYHAPAPGRFERMHPEARGAPFDVSWMGGFPLPASW